MGCERPAAFRTRARPTWCDEHITEITRRAGLEPLEPFITPTAWRLTRCLQCGCVAHYRFEYILDRNNFGEATCRACFWRSWSRAQLHDSQITNPPNAVRIANEHGYDYLNPLTDPPLPDDPHRVQCRYCHRISAERLGDIGWGCHCQVNPRRAAQTARPPGAPRVRRLLKDSGSAVLEWWAHDANEGAVWDTMTEHTPGGRPPGTAPSAVCGSPPRSATWPEARSAPAVNHPAARPEWQKPKPLTLIDSATRQSRPPRYPS